MSEPESYKNMSHREVVLAVGKQHDGLIPMKEVTEIFKDRVKTPSYAASAAYSTIHRLMKQGRVTKVREGLYKWVEWKEAPTLEFSLQQQAARIQALETALAALHDAADDVNAEHGTEKALCLICRGKYINPGAGIVHAPDCALLQARTVLARYRSASGQAGE